MREMQIKSQIKRPYGEKTKTKRSLHAGRFYARVLHSRDGLLALPSAEPVRTPRVLGGNAILPAALSECSSSCLCSSLEGLSPGEVGEAVEPIFLLVCIGQLIVIGKFAVPAGGVCLWLSSSQD